MVVAETGPLASLPVEDALVGAACGAVGTAVAVLARRLLRAGPAGRRLDVPGPLATSCVVWAIVAAAGGRVTWWLVGAALAGAVADGVVSRSVGIAAGTTALAVGAVAAAPEGIGPAAVLLVAAALAWPATVRVAGLDAAAASFVLLAATGGLFLGVPDVEDVAATGGVLAVAAAVGATRAERGRADRDRPLGVSAPLAVLVWLAATASLGRAPLVAGGAGLVLLAVPAALASVAVAHRPAPRLLRWSAAATAVVGAAAIARLGMVAATGVGRVVGVVLVSSLAMAGVLGALWRGGRGSGAAGATAQADGRGGRPASDR